MDKNEFIEKAREVHGDKYDYSLLPDGFIKAKEKVQIICPEHGVFWKDFQHHYYRSAGCQECSGKKRYTTEEFIEKCKKLPHTEEYTYENTVYVKTDQKVKIFCHHKDENGAEHGEFEITPLHLLSGEGCPKCRYIKSSAGIRRTIAQVIEQATSVHGGKYDYSLITEYKNDRIKYPIICPEHGVFYQTFNNHIKGKQGCPICGRKKCDSERALTTSEFIEKASATHNNKYDYSKTRYISSRDTVTITCPVHGDFEQIARNHLFGQGCPKCFFEKSAAECELFDYIRTLLPNDNVIENDRTILNGKEIDVYVPSLHIGFEMNGLIWHSEKFNDDKNYHLNKLKIANEKHIKLIQIFEDEWRQKNEICKSRIKNLLGITENIVYARNCEINEVSGKEAKKFLDENHVQGYTPSSINIGLFKDNVLLSLMTFGKHRINVGGKSKKAEYEIIRFANKINTSVVGGASKIFNFFIKKYNPNNVLSYADRRWSEGYLYKNLGFTLDKATPPSYFYVVSKKRVNRFSMRKDILVSKYGCPKEVTEKEFCESNGWYRIYDCGTNVYIWKKEN